MQNFRCNEIPESPFFPLVPKINPENCSQKYPTFPQSPEICSEGGGGHDSGALSNRGDSGKSGKLVNEGKRRYEGREGNRVPARCSRRVLGHVRYQYEITYERGKG